MEPGTSFGRTYCARRRKNGFNRVPAPAQLDGMTAVAATYIKNIERWWVKGSTLDSFGSFNY